MALLCLNKRELNRGFQIVVPNSCGKKFKRVDPDERARVLRRPNAILVEATKEAEEGVDDKLIES
jgi:hypothetical protein